MTFLEFTFLTSFIVFSITFFKILHFVRDDIDAEHNATEFSWSMATGFFGFSRLFDLYEAYYKTKSWDLLLVSSLIQIPLLITVGTMMIN